MAPALVQPKSAFFYGTLMSPAILARVTGRADLAPRPALLPAHRRHRVRGADYPAIVPIDDGASSVRGALVTGLTPADVHRLDVFEGAEYAREPVRVRLLPAVPPAATDSAQAEGCEVDCETYIWMAPRVELDEREWDFDEFVRDKLWRWAPGHGGETSGEYDDLDAAVAAQEDPTRGRAVGGGFEDAVKR